MTECEWAELLRHCPTLYHMAERGSWPGVQRHGLRSTAALLDLFEIPAAERAAIESAHRPDSVRLRHPAHGAALVRDQKPMSDAALRRCLQDGMTPPDWYRLLNGKVFFWLSGRRLLKLLGGREYRMAEHDVLEIDTAALVAACRPRVTLSPINSGATFNLGPAPRGRSTFQPIDRYDYASRRKKHPPAGCVVEMTVEYAVPDIAGFVRRVVAMRGGMAIRTVYEGYEGGQMPVNNQSSARRMSSR